jgi:hypothetical protein
VQENSYFNELLRLKKIGDKLKVIHQNPKRLSHSWLNTPIIGNKIISLNTLAPNLEDVFLKLTMKVEE